MLEDIYFVVFEELKIQRLGIFGSKKQKEGF
jgi:predicted RNA-binding protein